MGWAKLNFQSGQPWFMMLNNQGMLFLGIRHVKICKNKDYEQISKPTPKNKAVQGQIKTMLKALVCFVLVCYQLIIHLNLKPLPRDVAKDGYSFKT